MNLYDMCGLTGYGCQKLRYFINHNTIHATWHGVKWVIIRNHLYCLTYEQDKNLAHLDFIKSQKAKAALIIHACSILT